MKKEEMTRDVTTSQVYLQLLRWAECRSCAEEKCPMPRKDLAFSEIGWLHQLNAVEAAPSLLHQL